MNYGSVKSFMKKESEHETTESTEGLSEFSKRMSFNLNYSWTTETWNDRDSFIFDLLDVFKSS